jgi:hypothetical protein
MDYFVPRLELELSRSHKFQAAKSRKLAIRMIFEQKVMDEASFVDNQWPRNRYKKKLIDRKKPFVHRFQFQSFSVSP